MIMSELVKIVPIQEILKRVEYKRVRPPTQKPRIPNKKGFLGV